MDQTTIVSLLENTWIRILLVVIGTYLVSKVVDKLLNLSKRIDRMDSAEKTQFMMSKRLIDAAIYIIGFLVMISLVPSLKNLAVALFAGAGVIGIVIGFAAQSAFSNVISGIFMAIFQPFRVGDAIKVRNEYGNVEEITLRHTIIKTPDNRRIVVPNAELSQEYIENYSLMEEKMRSTVELGISYDSDIKKAKEIMLEEAKSHQNSIDHENTVVRVDELADSSVKLRMNCWAQDQPKAHVMSKELLESIKNRFEEEGIKIPFPQKTISFSAAEDRKKFLGS